MNHFILALYIASLLSGATTFILLVLLWKNTNRYIYKPALYFFASLSLLTIGMFFQIYIEFNVPSPLQAILHIFWLSNKVAITGLIASIGNAPKIVEESES